MPTSTLPDLGRVVYREQSGTVDAPAAGNSVFGSKMYWGPFGTFNPIALTGGLPIQFDTATAAVFGAPDSAAAADEGSTSGIIGLLKALLRELRSPLSIIGAASLEIGGSPAAAGPGAAGSTTLRTVLATDQPPVSTSPTVLGTTTREYALTNGVVTAFTATSSAAIALPSLGASREVQLNATEACWIVWGPSGVAAAAPAAGSKLVAAYSCEVVRVPAGATHFRVIRAAADGTLQILAVS